MEDRWEWRYKFRADTSEQVCEALEDACESPILHNVRWMARRLAAGQDVPLDLLAWNIRYIEPPGCDDRCSAGPCQPGKLAPDILESGTATCIDVVQYVCALLRLRGVEADPHFVPTADPAMFHGLVTVDGKDYDFTGDLITGAPVVANEVGDWLNSESRIEWHA